MSAPSMKKIVQPRKFMIAYRTPEGFGRFFNNRSDGSIPSEQDIVSMENKLEAQHGIQCTILHISELRYEVD